MSDISDKEWKSALTSILEQLDKSQYGKMRECLEKIPKGKRMSKVNMPQKIIEHYGLEESIKAIDHAMDEIPRRDPAVQDLLRPFVDKLRNSHEKDSKGQKRKRDEAEEEEERPAADQEKSCRPDEETKARPWKKSIRDLNSSSELHNTDVIAGKVFQKSGLLPSKTKSTSFYVAVADETGSVKMMVHGKKHHQQIQVEQSYLFRQLRRDDKGVVQVTTESTVSQTSGIKVPEKLEMEARKLIYSESPVCSITEAKSSADRTLVSVQGTVTELFPIEDVQLRDKRKKTKRQNFNLKDETDSIKICMWGEESKQCKGLSAQDVVTVINVRTNKYYETVSLNSTAFTEIKKVHSVGIQNARIQIIGIIKATKKETRLEAEFNGQVCTFVVASRLLANAFGLKLEGDLTESLLDKTKLPVDAVIQGNKITKLTAASV